MSNIGSVLWSLVFVALGILTVVVMLLLLKDQLDQKRGIKRSKHLSKEKKKAMYPSPPKKFLSKQPEGLTIGKWKSKYCNLPFLYSPVHQLILGSPGLGKSTMIITALINHFRDDLPDSKPTDSDFKAAIIVDCKPELIRRSCDERKNNLVRIVNPADINSPYGFDVFYGLDKDDTPIDEIKSRCTDISESLIKQATGDNAFFTSNARSILTGILMYEFKKGNGFIDAVKRIRSINTTDYIATIMSDPEIESIDSEGKIRGMLGRYEGQDSETFQSIVTELTTNLDVFDNNSVQKCFARKDHIYTPEDLLKGISLDLAIPDHRMNEMRFVFGLIINLCCKFLMSQDEYSRGSDKRPYWVLLDEGGTIYVPVIEDVLARGRSKGIMVTLIAQSQRQLRILYGRDQADAIAECCETQILLSCSDVEIADKYSKRAGQFREQRGSISKQGSYGMVSSSSSSDDFRNCWDVSDISMLPENGEALVFNRGIWFCIKKCPYFMIPEYKNYSDYVYQINKEYEGK